MAAAAGDEARISVRSRVFELRHGVPVVLLETTAADTVVLPPVLASYRKPKTIDDLLSQSLGKVWGQFDIEHDLFEPWP